MEKREQFEHDVIWALFHFYRRDVTAEEAIRRIMAAWCEFKGPVWSPDGKGCCDTSKVENVPYIASPEEASCGSGKATKAG